MPSEVQEFQRLLLDQAPYDNGFNRSVFDDNDNIYFGHDYNNI